MPKTGSTLAATLAATLLPAGVVAQNFADFCPDGDTTVEAAVVGFVTDPEAGTVVPGATVAASWVAEGSRRRAETRTDADGVYALCGLPQSAEVQLRATFGDRRGPPVGYRTASVLAQQDLEVSLTAEPEEEVELPEGAGNSAIYGATTIREEDLLGLPEMSVYTLLRQHGRLRFERGTTGERIVFVGRGVTGVPSISGRSRFRGVDVYVDERRRGDAILTLRQLSIDDVRQIDILTPSEASARYGGDGYIGIISIRTKER